MNQKIFHPESLNELKTNGILVHEINQFQSNL